MCNCVSLGSNENCTISKVGAGYGWLNSSDVNNNINEIINSHPNSYIIINMGTNSAFTTSEAKKM